MRLGGIVGVLATLGVAATAVAHDMDHPAPTFSEPAPLSTEANAGGENAKWDLIATIPTGNPQTDVDFFTIKGITYMSVGSLATGPNSAGQNIVQLTDDKGEVNPQYLTGHPSATCPKATSSATGLQHDPEASPKGQAFPQFPNPHIVTSDTQVVIDATDATGRCHDQGVLGVSAAPQGGLEIIDVSDPAKPKEIGLTSHVGQAHTVNVDPKRPHIAFVSSSDAVNYDAQGARANDEHPKPPPEGTAAPGAVTNLMDGIEVVDLRSCLNFPSGANLQFKRDQCRPQVYRYRWPSVDFARSSVYRATGACHELEIYPDDRLVCAGLMSSLLLDVSGAFDDMGTPSDYTDDKPKGTPLPCFVRPSSNQAASDPFETKAMVTDCVQGEADGDEQRESLRIPEWRKMSPPPSWEGVEKIGGAHHMGFENQQQQNVAAPYDSTKDIFVSHEAELTQSGRFMLVTDERGGGVLPVGASCSPGADNVRGNGGIHAFPVDKLGTAPPAPKNGANAEVDAYQEAIYAKSSDKKRAIFRTPVETEPQGNGCTSHVFQQIPGQNRIFMGWYSQGTQVVDFTENADGTIDFERAGYFIPENANTWTSHVFKVEQEQDGGFTYYGATGDFAAGDAGRNAIDIYKVTLPPPPSPRLAEPLPGTPDIPESTSCASRFGFGKVDARPRASRRRIRFGFQRLTQSTARIQVFRQSKGRRVIRRRVADFRNRRGPFTWRRASKLRSGYYTVRYTTRAPNGSTDLRHVVLRKRNGRFYRARTFDNRSPCDFVRYVSLGRPVFGGKRRAPMKIRLRLGRQATASFQIRRGSKVVKRIRSKTYRKGTNRIVVRLSRRAGRGSYRVTMTAKRPGEVSSVTLHSRRL